MSKPTPAEREERKKRLDQHKKRLGHVIGHYCLECQRIINTIAKENK